MTTNDFNFFNQWKNLNDLRDGITVQNKREEVISQARFGQKMLECMCRGEDFLDGKRHDKRHITDCIIQLIHFQQYVYMSQQIFLEWNGDELGEKNKLLTESAYLNAAMNVKYLKELLESPVFEDVLIILLLIKSNGDLSKKESILKICLNKVGEEWLASKMIKSLKTSL
jgi:hypothetical protein